MSKRSLKKRRHRSDFLNYLDSKPKDSSESHSHVHGPACHHGTTVMPRTRPDDWQLSNEPMRSHAHGGALIRSQILEQEASEVVEQNKLREGIEANYYEDRSKLDFLPQEDANAMTDDEWIDESRLTEEETEATLNADNEEGEAF